MTGLIESLLRNMHVPELLFNISPPLDSRDPWYRRIQPALQIRPEGRAALPEGWHFESDVDEGEGDEQRVVMQVWNCADGKQRMSAISKCVPILALPCSCATDARIYVWSGSSTTRSPWCVQLLLALACSP